MMLGFDKEIAAAIFIGKQGTTSDS